jgi:glycosyltransferase involved in cell wall biosynthesis
MRVLMISGDPHLLEAGSAAYERLELQRAQVERLDVFVWPAKHSRADIARAIREHGYDLVTAQDPFWRGLLALKVAKFCKMKLNVQVHTDLRGQSFFRHLLAQVVLRHADSIRVVSEEIKEQVQALGTHAPIHVLPIFLDVSAFRALTRKPHEQKTILWVGRLEKEKDPFYAVEVLKKIRAKGVNTKLIMVGAGGLEKELKERARDLPVEFALWQDSTLPYMEVADVVLVTSPYESWGASIVEALAAGVPVVAPDVGVAKEAGAIVVPRDMLTDSVINVLENKARGELKLPLIKDSQEWAEKWKETLL